MNTATRTRLEELEAATGFTVYERPTVKVSHFDPEDLIDAVFGALGLTNKGDIAHAVIVLEVNGGRRFDYHTVLVNDFSDEAPKGYTNLVADEICTFTRRAAGLPVSAFRVTLIV